VLLFTASGFLHVIAIVTSFVISDLVFFAHCSILVVSDFAGSNDDVELKSEQTLLLLLAAVIVQSLHLSLFIFPYLSTFILLYHFAGDQLDW
jgi:hypothetical protein